MTNVRGSNKGHCQGECEDHDDDCAEGLVCYDIRSEYEPVPGCSGEGERSENYCIKREDMPPGPLTSMEVFRLKMYFWENYSGGESGHRGYFCAECDGSCGSGQELDLGRCESSSDKWRFVNMDSDSTQIQLADGSDLCWYKSSRDIELRECDASEECQKFRPGRGSFGGYKFELVTCGDRCVTQQHYPRSGESLFGESCSRARKDKSAYWEKY